MDFVKLVEEGTYTKDMLSEKDKAFIEGMEYIKDNILTKDFIVEGDIDSISPIFAKIQKVIIDDIIMLCRERVNIEICDAIVSFVDGYDAQGDDIDGEG